MAEPAFAIGELLKLVVALGVTIGLFYALALFMKRLQLGNGRSGTLITVLGAMPLGGKEKIWVVDVAGEKLVIGTTPGNVNCLHVLKQDATVCMDSADVLPSSFPRKRESSIVDSGAETPLDPGFRRGDEVHASSFPRKRESSVVDSGAEAPLDPGFRRGDEVHASSFLGNDGVAAQGFAELLHKFRNWHK